MLSPDRMRQNRPELQNFLILGLGIYMYFPGSYLCYQLFLAPVGRLGTGKGWKARLGRIWICHPLGLPFLTIF